MKKLFISQPMRGKSKEEIKEEREIAIVRAKEIVGEDVEVLETFFEDFKVNNHLGYLAKSIEFLAQADVAYFARGWNKSRGCKIEHTCASEYDVHCIYHYGEPGLSKTILENVLNSQLVPCVINFVTQALLKCGIPEEVIQQNDWETFSRLTKEMNISVTELESRYCSTTRYLVLKGNKIISSLDIKNSKFLPPQECFD